MFRFFKNKGKLNWRYALGEVLLIFIGITAAIWFNNWNESNREKGLERKTLLEIKEAIGQDLGDIQENIWGFKKRIEVYNMILDYFDRDLAYDDSLDYNIQFLKGFTTFISNIGAYETLKSRGLETVRNDSLRLKISEYYDLLHENLKINESEHHNHYIRNMKPMLIQHFHLDGFRITPINYKQLKRDFEFRQNLNWALSTDSYMLDLYLNLKEVAENLTDLISSETNS